MVLEERERGAQHALDLRPALAGAVDRLLDELGPVGERREQHRAVERFLRGEVVQQARAPDADLVGDVVQARARVAVVAEAPQRDLEDEVLGRRAGTRGQRHLVSLPTRLYRPVGSTIFAVPLTNVVAAVVAAFVVTQLAIFTTTVYLHRALSHRALTVRGPAAFPFRVVIWMTTGHATARVGRGAPQAPRRDRHRRRPAQPAQVGFWRVQLGNVGLYKQVAADAGERAEVRARPPARPPRPARVRLRARSASASASRSWSSTMWALGFGLLTGLLAAGLHAVFYVMLSGAINAVGHTNGKQPYENSATNLQSLALITAGEGLHNNHHAAPTSARFALHKGEIDPGWWLVRVLVKLHLAQVRHDDVHLKTAAEPSTVAEPARCADPTVAGLRGASSGVRQGRRRRSWSGPQNSAGAGVVTPFSM